MSRAWIASLPSPPRTFIPIRHRLETQPVLESFPCVRHPASPNPPQPTALKELMPRTDIPHDPARVRHRYLYHLAAVQLRCTERLRCTEPRRATISLSMTRKSFCRGASAAAALLLIGAAAHAQLSP